VAMAKSNDFPEDTVRPPDVVEAGDGGRGVRSSADVVKIEISVQEERSVSLLPFLYF
jgi:hypothetical protein